MLTGNPEDRSTPPSKRRSETGDLLIRMLLYLSLERGTPFASGLVALWQERPQNYPATIGRLVAWTRPYLNPPGENRPPAQARAFELLTSLIEACVTITASAQEILTSGQEIGDELRQDLEAAAWIAHCIAQEIWLSPALRFGIVTDFCGVLVQSGRPVLR